jgi:pyruvate/2-oxoglutarate dehydrogenase complex dihydrolipoamide acyltransferase (E2) component
VKRQIKKLPLLLPLPTAEEAPETATSSDDSRVKASPLARKIAKDKGINLNAG